MSILGKANSKTAGENSGAVPGGLPPISLGTWNIYFLAKFILFWKGLIGFNPLYNLALAALLIAPIASARWRKVRTIAAVPVAIALLYYDSWLPPFQRIWSQAPLILSFTPTYLVELVGRFINWNVIALLVIAWVVHYMLSQRVRIGVLTIVVLVALNVSKSHQPQNERNNNPIIATQTTTSNNTTLSLDDTLKNFFVSEAIRSISFPPPSPIAPPFDIIFIHICSLSWDDIKAVGLQNHPLWKRFDMVFTHFNSVSTYSGPAAIRILRSTCGQSSHKELYDPAPSNCYLMSSLQRSGFQPNLALNHDGHFDDFLHIVQNQGGLNIPPLPIKGLPVAQHAFDGSPVYDDLSVLSRWLDNRPKDSSSRVALYYNTISLHDGNYLTDSKVSGDSMETYKARLAKLLDELDQFMQKINYSGRRALVVMVPEHGAAVRGDKMQIAGLREIPSPAITLVPVGIKVIGPVARRSGDTLQVDEPTSFLAITYIVAQMMEKSPFEASGFFPANYTSGLPTTQFVAQNEDATMVEHDGRYYLKQRDGAWINYDLGVHP